MKEFLQKVKVAKEEDRELLGKILKGIEKEHQTKLLSAAKASLFRIETNVEKFFIEQLPNSDQTLVMRISTHPDMAVIELAEAIGRLDSKLKESDEFYFWIDPDSNIQNGMIICDTALLEFN